MLEKKEVTPDELTTAKDKFREELLGDRRNRFFSAYMTKAKQKMKIEVNREALQRVSALDGRPGTWAGGRTLERRLIQPPDSSA